jgi:hypothetical protein
VTAAALVAPHSIVERLSCGSLLVVFLASTASHLAVQMLIVGVRKCGFEDITDWLPRATIELN